MITEFAKATISYMKENLEAEAIASIGFFAMAFLLVFALVLLIFRKTRLWYWKTEEQVQTLKGIDTTLAEIRQGVENVHKSMEAINKSDKEPTLATEASEAKEQEEVPEGEVPTEKTPKLKELEDSEEEEDKAEEPTEAMESQEEPLKVKRAQNVGKSGVIYEDEALREQIKY